MVEGEYTDDVSWTTFLAEDVRLRKQRFAQTS